MNGFHNRLKIEAWLPHELPEGSVQLWTLLEDFVFDSTILGRLAAAKDLTTDFASIPRIAWRYIDPEDPVIMAASVIHDQLYKLMGILPEGTKYTREQADQVLIEIMKASGARWDQQKVVYRMVRLFGASHWKD